MTEQQLLKNTGDAALDAALAESLGMVRSERRRMIILIVLSIAVIVAAFATLTAHFSPAAGLPALGATIYLVYMGPKLLVSRIRRRMSLGILPHLATAVGLTFEPDAPPDTANNAARHFANRTYKLGEDRIIGRAGHRGFEAIDLTVRNKTKEQTEVFRGLFVTLEGATGPDLLIAPEHATKDRRFFGPVLDTAGMTRISTLDAPGDRALSVYVSALAADHDGAARFADAICGLINLEPGLGLHALSRDGGSIHVALGAGRDLLALSSSVWSDAALAADIRNILRQLNAVYDVVRIVMAAEGAETAAD